MDNPWIIGAGTKFPKRPYAQKAEPGVDGDAAYGGLGLGGAKPLLSRRHSLDRSLTLALAFSRVFAGSCFPASEVRSPDKNTTSGPMRQFWTDMEKLGPLVSLKMCYR